MCPWAGCHGRRAPSTFRRAVLGVGDGLGEAIFHTAKKWTHGRVIPLTPDVPCADTARDQVLFLGYRAMRGRNP